MKSVSNQISPELADRILDHVQDHGRVSMGGMAGTAGKLPRQRHRQGHRHLIRPGLEHGGHPASDRRDGLWDQGSRGQPAGHAGTL
ncbi:hypothetical protein [Magnetospirillum sp. ME-1]|uniref:hypothetical protein n=1 Tax=Magnetospirillum sp. ME-1 TaxID=1639348 RepID=UPI0011AE7C70|nr:hypothetical protein [Magnetospirillum sp. ME-1]